MAVKLSICFPFLLPCPSKTLLGCQMGDIAHEGDEDAALCKVGEKGLSIMVCQCTLKGGGRC